MSIELKSTIAKQRKKIAIDYLQAQKKIVGLLEDLIQKRKEISQLTIKLEGIKKVNKSRKVYAFIAHTILGLCLVWIGSQL